MKLYKFRALSNCDDFSRIKKIIETGEFWCSKFMDMNDPMEGVYRLYDNEKIKTMTKSNSFLLDIETFTEIVNEIYEEKEKYKICSFSGKKGFEKPTMWGHYANGFKGVAIEIEIDERQIIPIDYYNKNPNTINEILSSKDKCWKYEDEYRFLRLTTKNNHKIGQITKVYFGNPFNNVSNEFEILQKNQNLMKYRNIKKELENFLLLKKIEYVEVEVSNGKVRSKRKSSKLK